MFGLIYAIIIVGIIIVGGINKSSRDIDMEKDTLDYNTGVYSNSKGTFYRGRQVHEYYDNGEHTIVDIRSGYVYRNFTKEKRDRYIKEHPYTYGHTVVLKDEFESVYNSGKRRDIWGARYLDLSNSHEYVIREINSKNSYLLKKYDLDPKYIAYGLKIDSKWPVVDINFSFYMDVESGYFVRPTDEFIKKYPEDIDAFTKFGLQFNSRQIAFLKKYPGYNTQYNHYSIYPHYYFINELCRKKFPRDEAKEVYKKDDYRVKMNELS